MLTGSGDADEQQDWYNESAHQHLVQFYESDDYLLDSLTGFASSTLANREACVVVATPDHVDELRRRLAAGGVDVETVSRQGQLVTLEITATMDRFMDHGVPDAKRFEAVFGPLLGRTVDRWGSTRVFGEMVAVIARTNNRSAAPKLERLWNDLLTRYDFTLCCAYPMSVFSQTNAEELMGSICDQHTEVFPAESYPYRSSAEDRRQAIALLQQKAARLSVEVDNRKQIEERLRVALNAERAARQEAEGALHVRDEFVSVAAHELKTPLTSLIGRAQFVLRSFQHDNALDSTRAISALESVVSQANKLTRLINQLLDVTRLKGGNLPIERRPVDLVTLVWESFDSVRPDIDAFDVIVLAPESRVVEIDPIRMEQVIVNLLNNAVKYSPEGSRIEVTISEADSRTVQISVRDHGPGISPEQRAHIFERFYQADRVGPRHGLGLGLYISWEIVELHGGTINAEFPRDGGTRFVVEIPVSSPSDTSNLL